MVLRGSSTVRSGKKKRESRASGGRRGNAYQLRLDWGLKEGESVETFGYFCGLFEEEVDVDEYFGSDGKPDLGGLDSGGLYDLATEIGARLWDEIKDEHLRSSIERRLTQELEPVIWYRHYVDRNKGKYVMKGGKKSWLQTYQNCGDPDAVHNAENYDFETKCRSCHERQNGDQGVGNASQRVCWSWYDLRYQHRTKGEDGDKDEYNDCTEESKGRCAICSRNRRIDDTPQEDMEREHLKDLFENNGYSPRYQVAMRVLDLPASQEPVVNAYAAEIRTRYCRCGGNLRVTGAECPECENEYDFDELVENGWNPEEPDPDKRLQVRCGECAEKGVPKAVFECDECDDPTPARLGDVKTRIKVTKGAKGSTWSFQIAGDVAPLELGEDEETDRVLGSRMPDFDQFTKPPTAEEQMEFLGLRKDPLGEVDDGPDSAPSMSGGSKGGKAGKGKKGGKGSKGSKGGKQKKSGFLSRG